MEQLTILEQQRIERNRQEAIAKRRASVLAQENVIACVNTSNSANRFQASASCGAALYTCEATGRQSVFLKPVNNVKQLKGHLTIISTDRFVVNIGYNKQYIAACKTILGRRYDTTTKLWSFPIAQHGSLMLALDKLKPDVVISALPLFVLKIFTSSTGKTESKVDNNILSNMGQQLATNLFDFQKEGVCFGIRKKGRCLIADDMGLGKTIQALGIAHYYYEEWPLLIATPCSMRFEWRNAIVKWLPEVPFESITVVETTNNSITLAKVVIITYKLLEKRQAEFQQFRVVIMDESHNLKNSRTARAKAILPIIRKATRAILLSGTPALSRPFELYTQISSINTAIFPSMQEFGLRYCDGKHLGLGRRELGWDFSGSSNLEELQIVLNETVMIRRLKCEVLRQLPLKQRTSVLLNLSDDNRASLTELKCAMDGDNFTTVGPNRANLLSYYRETARAKVASVVNYISNLVQSQMKFLCFGHHKEMLDGICVLLDERKTKYIRIDGSKSSEERDYFCQQFQSCDDVKVAVLSITAASVGITLTAAHLVVFAELFWNPGVLRQAEDRVHRIGQEHNVQIEYLVAPGTSDDVMWPIICEKLDILSKLGLSQDTFRNIQCDLAKHQPVLSDPELENILSDELGQMPGGSSSKHLSSNKNLTSDLPAKQMRY